MTVAVRTALRGLLGLSKAALNREPVDDATLSQRRRTCAACPAATRTRRLGLHPLNVLTATSACSACRCNLHAKTRLAGEACPRGHWATAKPIEPAIDHSIDHPAIAAPTSGAPAHAME